MTETEYWNDVAIKTSKAKENMINDNWFKRGQLVKRLLDYNFYRTRVLEIGCGLGMTAQSLRLVQGLFKYDCTDTSDVFCDFVRDTFHMNPKQAKANDLPYDSDKFDCIFVFDVLEHIQPDERLQSYGEMLRVLRTGGRVFINNPLTQSNHDVEFDFGFTDYDLTNFMSIGFKLEKLEEYQIGNDYKYEFIVLVKK